MGSLIVGLSKRKGWFEPFSWVIQLAGKRPYSHAYIRFHSDSYNRDLVYQASGFAVNFMEYGKFQTEESVYAEFLLDIDDNTILKTVQYAIDNVGEPYGFMEAVGLGIYLAFRFVGIRLKGNPFATNTKTVCAKLVEEILNDFANQNIPIDPNVVMPGDIFDAMVNNPSAKRLL